MKNTRCQESSRREESQYVSSRENRIYPTKEELDSLECFASRLRMTEMEYFGSSKPFRYERVTSAEVTEPAD